MSRDVDDYILGIDILTGKKSFEHPMEDNSHAVATLNALPLEDGNFQIFGLAFDKDAKTGKATSTGLFGFTMNSEGKIITRKYLTWAKDFSKFLKMNEKGKVEDVGFLYFQKFVRNCG